MNSIESSKQKGNLKGNRYVRGGKYGERKKTDGTDLKEKECPMRVSVETKSREALKHILDRHDKLQDLPPAKKQKWDRLHAGITDPEAQFSKKRVAAKTEDFELKRGGNTVLNRLQQRAGQVDMTPIDRGETPYSSLTKIPDTRQLLMEMRHRTLPTDGGWKNQWIPRRKESETARGQTNTSIFNALCPAVDFSHVWQEDVVVKARRW
jgi:hypothetical protein